MAVAEKQAATGHTTLRLNEVGNLLHEGMILGKADGELSLGRSAEALETFRKAFTIADEIAEGDPNDALSRHHVAEVGLEIGNILRHTNPREALAVYDHSLARIREAKSNSQTQRDEAELLVASSYAERWTSHVDEARRRIDKGLLLLSDAKVYPADKIEPMSAADHASRASADFLGATGQSDRAIEEYQELQKKLAAWNLDPDNDLRDAVCLSRTWLAQAELFKHARRTPEAVELEARSQALLKHWTEKLPGYPVALRQAFLAAAPFPNSRSNQVARPQAGF